MANESLKNQEEQKRDRAYDPLQRWLHIQQTITWAEANMLPHLRRNRPRLPKPWPRAAETDTPPQDPHGS